MPALSLDIAVIGGGPGGLAAALAIRRASPGLTLKVVTLLVMYALSNGHTCYSETCAYWYSVNSGTQSNPKRRQLITENGLIGLASSYQGKHKSCSPGNVQVFERSTATQPRGAGISLEVNGLKALEGISPDAYSTVMKNSVHFSTMATVDVQGNQSEPPSQKLTMQAVLLSPKQCDWRSKSATCHHEAGDVCCRQAAVRTRHARIGCSVWQAECGYRMVGAHKLPNAALAARDGGGWKKV